VALGASVSSGWAGAPGVARVPAEGTSAVAGAWPPGPLVVRGPRPGGGHRVPVARAVPASMARTRTTAASTAVRRTRPGLVLVRIPARLVPVLALARLARLGRHAARKASSASGAEANSPGRAGAAAAARTSATSA
jgi:hypothetical protein